jgi:type I restriction enzyme M protein
MAIKKSELYSSQWSSCDELRGVLFRGHAEAHIRRNLIRQGIIKGIIGLPANLFYGTGIPACIIVLDKENAQARKAIFMIDASKGYTKDGNKNRLRSQDMHKIVDVFNRQIELPRYSRRVSFGEIEENDYNLNIPRYIDSSEPEDLHDLDAHLNGGIPERDIDALARYWQVFPTLRQTLAGRVKALEERYAEPLPALAAEMESFSARVEGHLKKVGLVWEVRA